MFESVGFIQEGVGLRDVSFDGQYPDSLYYGLLEDSGGRERGMPGAGEEDPDS